MIGLDSAYVQESAILYIYCSLRSVLPKNGCGIWSACTCLYSPHCKLACTAFMIGSDSAYVQESAILYIHFSLRSVLPKNGCGIWSAFLWLFSKNTYERVWQRMYMVYTKYNMSTGSRCTCLSWWFFIIVCTMTYMYISFMICTYMSKHGMYYSIGWRPYIHGLDMYVHVYTRWVGFQM